MVFLMGNAMTLTSFAGQDNVAHLAKVSVSDALDIGFDVYNLVDDKLCMIMKMRYIVPWGEYICHGLSGNWKMK